MAELWSELFSPASLVTCSLAAVFIVLYLKLLVRWKNGSLRVPPGPRGVPLLGYLPFLDPELHSGFAELAKTYGPILSLKLGNKLGIVVTSSSLAKEVLRDHDTTFANRDVPAAARVISYGGSDIAWTPHGPEWRMLRKVCVREMLGTASLDSVYYLRRREMRATVSHIYSKVGGTVNVGEQMFLTILNVITSMLWGGTVEGEERTSIGSEFRQVVGEITELLGKPNLSDFFPGLAKFDVQGLQRQMKGLFLRFDGIFNSIIEHRLKKDREGGKVDEEKSKDFLQFMLKLKDEGDQKTPFTMVHLKALLMDMVVGGTDTTSNMIEWAMAHMVDKPVVMKKVQDELERVVGRGNIVEESHVSKLHYLDAVVKEVLRLHPALPLLVPHCPSQSCTVGGYTIPEGSRVFVNVWAIHRDPSIWPSPLEFDPERFTQPTAKWDYSGNDFHYFPFGSGRRICAGITMAQRMMMYALASLVHSFDWSLPQGEKLDLSEKFGIVIKKAIPLVAVPTPRSFNLDLYK
ncbi:geraniol 8-hydroxylase-like [Aristolochia californica]|uniref:geraniol 8-hydroxylase-like n=1 Tax=Aristolochia californica TaxID=171875 RepID=UPI0035DE21EF